jgi:3-hydroxybutyryl-CoA dehydrogenase
MTQVAVVGAGLIGHGIAQVFARAGHHVRLTSRSEASLERATGRIESNLRMLTEMGSITRQDADLTISNIHPTSALVKAVDDADVVFEAVYEDLDLKRDLFRRLDRVCREKAILASSTSTFTATQLGSATGHPDRVVVAHFINPPYLMPLVEVVPGIGTSRETVATIVDLVERAGNEPVVIKREVPGFVSVRLQMALAREAISLVQGGVASPADIDTVITTSIGRRWATAGVFEVLDIAGWDTISAVGSQVLPDLDPPSEVPTLLREKVERGELGIKSGRGFYAWTPESAEASRQRIARALIEIGKWPRDEPAGVRVESSGEL